MEHIKMPIDIYKPHTVEDTKIAIDLWCIRKILESKTGTIKIGAQQLYTESAVPCSNTLFGRHLKTFIVSKRTSTVIFYYIPVSKISKYSVKNNLRKAYCNCFL